MKQSCGMSLVEAIANVAVGYGIVVVAQILIFTVFGLYATFGERILVGAIFTATSIIRSYSIRRIF